MFLGLCIHNIGYGQTSFAKHLEVIKIIYIMAKPIGKIDDHDIVIFNLLNVSDLDCQQGMFKLTMKLNTITYMAPLLDIFL
jgi:hypothetical protein